MLKNSSNDFIKLKIAVLKKITNFINKNATWNIILILLGIVLVFNILIFPLVFTTRDAIPLDLQFSYSTEKAYKLLSHFNERELQRYIITEFTVDLLYPIIYTLLLVFFIFKLTKKSRLYLFPLLILFSDYCENIGVVSLIYNLPQKLPVLVAITSIFTSLKWILVAVTLLLILALLVTKVFVKKKKT